MSYLKYIVCITFFSLNTQAMRHEALQEDASIKRYAKNFRPQWANPAELNNGFYLASVNSMQQGPFRLSNLAFSIESDEQGVRVAIDDEHAIDPLIVLTNKKHLSNILQLDHKCQYDAGDKIEIACMKVEHLLDPQINKLLTIVRTINSEQCMVKSYIDSGHHTTSILDHHLNKPKKVTRVFVDINDEDLEALNIETNTFTCE